jgi:hypothetical protein
VFQREAVLASAKVPLTASATISLGGGVLQAGCDRVFGLGFGLSGDTPGKREELGIRRVSATARMRRFAHAESDSLKHSAVVCHA